MTLDEVCSWVASVFKLGDRRRSRSLGEMVWGMLLAPVVSYAAIGRSMASQSLPASEVTRVYRFCHNKHVDPRAVQGALIAQLAGRAKLSVCGFRLVAVAIDWHAYDNGRIHALRVSLVTGSRALPLLWYEIEKAELKGRRTSFELQAIRDLVTFRPPGVAWLFLLDAGFRSPAVLKLLDEAGFYVVRSQSASLYHAPNACWSAVGALRVAVGEVIELGWCYLTQTTPLRARLVAARLYDIKPKKAGLRRPRRTHNHTKPGLCVVATNLPMPTFHAMVVLRLYGRRFEVEHGFRDLKNATFGMDMEHVHLKDAASYERLLCIVAIAEALLWLMGTEGEILDMGRRLSPSQPKDGRRVLSLRNIGRHYIKLPARPLELMLSEHISDAIAGVINVVGRGWKDARLHLQLASLITERLNARLPDKCEGRSRRHNPPCSGSPVFALAPKPDTLFFPAQRADSARCVHA